MSKKTPPRGQLSWIQPAADQLSWLDVVEPAQVDDTDLSYTNKDFIPSAQVPHMPEDTTLTPEVRQCIHEDLQARLKQELAVLTMRERYPYQFEVAVTTTVQAQWQAFYYCYQGRLRCYAIEEISEAG